MNQQQTDYDVIVLGGGMVGAALAVALGQADFRVLVLDTRAELPRWEPAQYDIRVSAITRASENILRHLGVWAAIGDRRRCAYRDMRVWDALGDGAIHFDSAELAEPCLGHIIENSVMAEVLWQRMTQLDRIEVLHPVRVSGLDRQPQRACLTLQDGRSLSALLVVGADGSRSWLRQTLGIEEITWPYRQSALVATVASELSHEYTAWQRFLPTGPLAFLPLDRDHCSIVWSTVPEQAEALAQMPEADFNQALAEAFDHRLGWTRLQGPRGVFPLRLLHARDYVDQRVALVGDAAHTIHPLAGQGVNLGYGDAATLAEVLIAAREKGQDLGLRAVLRRYERWRKGQNLATMGLMDGFKRLFSNDDAALKQLRNLGLGLVDRSGALKTLIARHAMGLDGDLPFMARAGQIHVRHGG